MTDCLWDDQVLGLSLQDVSRLPKELLVVLSQGTNTQYLAALAQISLDPTWTEIIFVDYEPLFVDIGGIWVSEYIQDVSLSISVLRALASLLPFCPRLGILVQNVVAKVDYLKTRSPAISKPCAKLEELQSSDLTRLLISLLRLLDFDHDGYSFIVSPVQMNSLLVHEKLHIRYLACRILALLFHFTSRSLARHVERYCGSGPLVGEFGGIEIDFRYFNAWETQRRRNLTQLLQNQRLDGRSIQSGRQITATDLCNQSVNFAGYIVPRSRITASPQSRIVTCPTAERNLKLVAESICGTKPALIVGGPGSGKSALIEEIALRLDHADRMVILHLNAQTDAKLLIGLYTSDLASGSFKWQPGVLTKAVLEGRWVLVEDLDRAPPEVMSVLLSLLDDRELMVPNLGGRVKAAPEFKMIGTIRSTVTSDADTGKLLIPELLGIRHWSKVSLAQYTPSDLHSIISQTFPILHRLQDRILGMYQAVKNLVQDHTNSQARLRSIGLQELIRFCRRSSNILHANGVNAKSETFPSSINVQMFLEGIDVFGGSISPGSLKTEVINIVAKELHISKDNVRYCLDLRVPTYERQHKNVTYGRVDLPVIASQSIGNSKKQKSKHPFARTNHSLRYIESIASAVRAKDACLLVGETGTGKTTVIQELANAVGQELFVVNLSQQSEVGDLLGGFKPVTLKALATPIKEEFDALFDETLKSNKNEKFTSSLDRNFKKGEWTKVLKLFQEASKTAMTTLTVRADTATNPSKKRKIDAPKYERLKSRWSDLISSLELFRQHLQSGPKGFAFSFVEGNLVKALRRGSWVLLDEINLASPDTLETISDLLSSDVDSSPSLLLSEAGNIERIQAHKDFRIFAAMNPATDVGKRELPSSVRSRFSEYYISSCENDMDSLLQICSAYLGDYIHSDLRITRNVADLFQAIRTLEKDNKLVDGASQKPHFTLRTLSRTLTYAMDIVNTYGLRRSLFEGFSMTFLTLLDSGSISLVKPLIFQHLLASQKNVRSIIHQIPKCPGDPSHYVQFRHYWMAKGRFSVIERPHYIITPFVEANLLNLVRATSTKRYPVLLQGPTSSGKTSMLEYLANISGNEFVRINNHEHTDLQEYLGTYVSGPEGLQFQDGVLVKAIREGHWLVLDELNLAPTDILEALNRLLDDNRELLIPETQEVVRPHPDFMLFATQNPPGLYGGRKILSRAFRNRFLELHFDDIPENELETILRERSQIAPSYCTRIVEVYKRLTVLRQSTRLFEQKNSFATLRDLFRWALRDADNVEQLATNGFMLIGERVRDPTERKAVQEIIEEVMKVKLDIKKLYTLDATTLKGINSSGPVSRSTSMTQAMSRVYTLVAAALRNKEPVLLIGDTGCGKTTICQLIAEVADTNLHILNAHQNTETGDIIGALRPVRNKEQIASDLHALLEQLYKADTQISDPEITLDQATRWYTNLPETKKSSISDEKQAHVAELLLRSKALFEWADGALVVAMQSGHHFLLDEISLADDSVLERLNSVLEPSRTLLLAEKGTVGSLVTAHPDFQFLATMNPGGDYGKKELSPALRNRFTEIWVPELDDEKDLLEIVTPKLNPTLRNLASPLVAFAKWFEKVCNESKVGVSVRQILTWVDFINIDHIGDTSIRLVQGAAMVYIDGLGADPSAKVYLSNRDIDAKRELCFEQLQTLFDIPARAIYHTSVEVSNTTNGLAIGPFKVQRNHEVIIKPSFSLDAPTTAKNGLRILRALQISKPILVEGSPGVGKTSLIEAIARTISRPLTRINLSDQTDLMDLFGSDVPSSSGSIGNFEWRDGPFLTAMQNGEWVLLDEMNLASQSVLEGLNACLDHRGKVYVPELDRSFIKHPHFMLFATQNPHAQGGGRKGLPASFVNRFTTVFAEPLNEVDMAQIATEMCPHVETGVAKSLASYMSSLNEFIAANAALLAAGGPWEFNLRDILRWISLIDKHGSTLGDAMPGDYENMLVIGRLRTSEDRRTVSSNISPPFLASSRARLLSQSAGAEYVQFGFGLRSKSWLSNLHAQLPLTYDLNLLESVLIAIEQDWPCLLVGSSGSGKSTLIQGLASQVGANVTILALNNEIDTMDILGGFEQTDYTRDKQKILRDMKSQICLLWSQSTSSAFERKLAFAWSLLTEHDKSTAHLIEQLRSLAFETSSDIPTLVASLARVLENEIRDRSAGFEWVDGVLIRALQQGDWLVLDNANLCNPSVLDRLNALLEPNGILSLNEHRLENGSPRIVRRHPQFRVFLTMDPRHGELSRAMRNRCIELYILDDRIPVGPPIKSSSFECESPFDFLRKSDYRNATKNELEALISVSLSRLSVSDHLNFVSWYDQILKGLHDLQPQVHSLLREVQQAVQASYTEPAIVEVLRAIYVDYLKTSHFSEQEYATIISSQSIDPTANTALLSCVQRQGSEESLVVYTELCHVRLKVRRLQQQLNNSQQVSLQKARNHLTSLERSLIAHTDRKFAGEASASISTLLLSVLKFLDARIDTQILSEPYLIVCFQEIVDYCRDLCNSASGLEFDDSILYTHIRCGWMLQRSLSRSGHELESNVLEHSLKLFGNITNMQNMEILWRALKPMTPRDYAELSQIVRLEGLVTRLDNVFWRSTASITTITKYMLSFRARCSSLKVGNESDAQELENVVMEEEKSALLELTAIGLQLQSEFDILRQQICLAGATSGFEQIQKLWVISGHGVCDEIILARIATSANGFSTLGSITGDIGSSSYLGVLNSNTSAILIQKLKSIPATSLRSYSRLQEEIQILCEIVTDQISTFAQNRSKQFGQILKRLMLEVLTAYQDQIPEAAFKKWSMYLQMQEHTSNDYHDLPDLGPIDRPLDHSNYDSRMLSTAFSDTLKLLNQSTQSSTAQEGSRSALGHAWILFSLACLDCYIPDQPFDPALGPKIGHQVWLARTAELKMDMLALEKYEQTMIGQPTQFRRQILTKRRELLGSEPAVLPIVRPEKSKIADTHNDLTNVRRTVVKILRTGSTPVVMQDCSKIDEIRRHVAANIYRLRDVSREYMDIAQPAIGFLQALDIGLALVTPTERSSSHLPTDVLESRPTSGIFGIDIQCILGNSTSVNLVNGANSLDHRMIQLLSIDLIRSIEGPVHESPVLLTSDLFGQFFAEWKCRLGKDQAQAAAQSSVYHFKGNSETDDLDAAEVDALFPSFDSDATLSDKPQTMPPAQLAQILADVHASIYADETLHTAKMVEFLLDVSQRTVTGSHNSSKDIVPISSEDLLTSLLIHLDNHRQYLGTDTGDKVLDFYHQPSLRESSRLTALVRKLRLRFREIQSSWPEHATLGHVLVVVEEILDSQLNSPLAKLIIVTERLHEFVNEWQTVASREFSAASLYEELTSLLVDWRRSELSTWSCLLDNEEKKHKEEAKSWWFVAYEAIVHPLSTLDISLDQTRSFASTLSHELHTFLRTATLGQFTARLKILAAFQRHVAAIAKAIPSVCPVSDVLCHTLEYFKRWQDKVTSEIKHRRTSLDAKMKDIILLASWKDINIAALRASARRSHGSLFRIVKKYRDVLALPAETLLTGIAKDPAPRDQNETILVYPRPALEIEQASIIINSNLQLLESLPKRLLSSSTTASVMARVGSMPSGGFDPAIYLESVHKNLTATIKSLQKETPLNLNDENKVLVKHLKTRKRNLLADTLKELRKMGIRTNPNMEVLATQDSTTKVLAFIAHDGRLSTSRQDLYKFLDDMSEIRLSSRQHSNDLAPNEVVKCIGSLEGVLFQMCHQHQILSSGLQQIDHCDELLSLLRSLWQPSIYTISSEKHEIVSRNELRRRLSWSLAMVSTAKQLIEMTGNMNQIDYSDETSRLVSYEERISTLLSELDHIPDLSAVNLLSSSESEYMTNARETLEAISSDIKEMTTRRPNIRYILDHILPWLNVESPLNPVEMPLGELQHPSSNGIRTNVATSQKALNLEDVINQMLVGLQNGREAFKELPGNAELPHWLKKHEDGLAQALTGLRMDTIVENLKLCLLDGIGLDEASIKGRCATIALSVPLLQEYRDCFANVLYSLRATQSAFCSLASTLSLNFKQIIHQGFCSPKEKSGQDQDSKQTEGVGLGEGEGAEDISNDVQDDEDLSELAQGAQREQDDKSDKDGLEKEDNAVDLGDEDLDGEFDAEGNERNSEEDESKSQEGDEDNEEVGQVDDLDPSAVDEKLWEDEADKDLRDKEAKTDGKQSKNEQIQEEEDGKAEAESESNEPHSGENLDEHDLKTDEMDQLDPHVNEDDKLELPEDMQIDGNKAMESDDDDMTEGLSDISEQEMNDQDDLEASGEDISVVSNEDQAQQDDEDALSKDAVENAAEDVETQPDQDDMQIEEDVKDKLRQENGSEDADNHQSTDQQGSGLNANIDEDNTEDNQPDNIQKGASEGQSKTEDANAGNSGAQNGEPIQTDPQQTTDATGELEDLSQPEALPQPFRKLGEVLEKWRQSQTIRDAAENQSSQTSQRNQEVQHLNDDDDIPDAQALGPAAEEEARALNKDEYEMEIDDEGPEPANAVEKEDQDDLTMDEPDQVAQMNGLKAETFIGDRGSNNNPDNERDSVNGAVQRQETIEDLRELDHELSEVKISTKNTSMTSIEQARRLWQQCENSTRDLALSLTEELRLILAPSLATKMRGDFRTGKRLNIKRIIPYIASGYKRDKIWMRRSMPSKRSYQIMLAVDDSKSMSESGSSKLAFETLALLTRSLSMLEVGQICIASFGESFDIAHDFEQTFSTEAAVKMFQHFTFDQTKTNVRNLMAKSLDAFREARSKQLTSNTELWQLQLIISDGVCEDHESIRRLVRQAHEERIMIVFAVINSADNHSILNMTQASFGPDENGETTLKIKRYLDGFPFSYYLIVGDIKNLPGVLSTALRQWFAEVADSS